MADGIYRGVETGDYHLGGPDQIPTPLPEPTTTDGLATVRLDLNQLLIVIRADIDSLKDYLAGNRGTATVRHGGPTTRYPCLETVSPASAERCRHHGHRLPAQAPL